jgi:hypothetical protein
MSAPIPPDVKKVVSFVFVENDKGAMVPNGTGFFVAVTNEVNKGLANVYLVTAKHVLHRPNDGPMYPRMWIRLNKHAGDASNVQFDLRTAGANGILTHPDPSVDLAVLPWCPDPVVYDYKYIQDDLLAGPNPEKDIGIAEGSDVFFVGLFTSHYGQHRNFPIARFGKVAMLPAEKVSWRKKPDGTDDLRALYLLETQSYGGNSGSPVFFYLGADRRPGVLNVGPHVLKLAGVLVGSFLDVQPVQVIQNAPKLTPVSVANMGIAAVVPCHLLRDILFSDLAKRQRGARAGASAPPAK